MKNNNTQFFNKTRLVYVLLCALGWLIGIIAERIIEPYIKIENMKEMIKMIFTHLPMVFSIIGLLALIFLLIYWKIRDLIRKRNDQINKLYTRIKALELINRSYNKLAVNSSDLQKAFSPSERIYISELYKQIEGM